MKKDSILSIAFLGGFIAVIFCLSSAFISPSGLIEKRFNETVAKGDSVIMTEYLNGFDRLAVCAKNASTKNFEEFMYEANHDVIKANDSMYLSTDFKVLEKVWGTNKTARYVIDESDIHPVGRCNWFTRTTYLLGSCSPKLKKEIERILKNQNDPWSWSIWGAYYKGIKVIKK